MKKFVKLGALAVAMLFLAVNVQAQKFGYVNSAAILADLAEVKQMQSSLKSLQTQLEKKGQQLVTDYQAKEREAIAKQERGELSPVEEQTVLQDLQTKQQEIMKFQQEMQEKLVAKEQELLEPILKRIETAINSVADEGGYTYIFDSASGAILYADENSNLNELVKAKLIN